MSIHQQGPRLSRGILIVTALVITACDHSLPSQPPQTADVEQQYLPTALPAIAEYQPQDYQGTTQGDPFMSMPSQQQVLSPHPVTAPMAEPECVPKEQQTQALAKTWSLRATFIGGGRSSALIDMPNIGISISAVVGQQLMVKESRSPDQSAVSEWVEIMAISNQEITLKHHQGQDSNCPHTQIVTLNLYSE